jgi:hypothetical protein
LVICGWSGEWDTALRAAIERCPVRRFSTYWSHIQELSSSTETLITKRAASKIAIAGADHFFSNLLDKINSLEELERPHPLSAKLATASVKRYIVEDKYRIKLADLVHDETEAVYASLTSNAFGMISPDSFAALFSRIEMYESLLEILIAILVTGTYWGRVEHAKIWVRTIQRTLDAHLQGGGFISVLNASLYPALLLHYATGLTCVASNNYQSLQELFSLPKMKNEYQSDAIFSIFPGNVIDINELNAHQNSTYYLPVNQRLFTVLREPLRPYVPSDDAYKELFDRFEYIRALIAMDLLGPPMVGLFAYRDRSGKLPVSKIFEREIQEQQASFPLLEQGYFGKDIDRLTEVQEEFDTYILKYRR